MPTRTRTPYTHPLWQPTRLAILQRDGHRCQLCGKPDADTVDHIIPWRDGGAWFDPNNLRACCRSCNSARVNPHLARLAALTRNGTAGATTTYPPPSRHW